MNELSYRGRRVQRVLDHVVERAGRALAPAQATAERALVHAVSSPTLSRATGRLADLRLPRPMLQRLIRAYVRAYDVDLSEVADDLDDFETFNAFFTRRLRDGARPPDPDEDVLLSPSDSRLHDLGRVPAHGLLDQIKGRRYRVGALLGDEGEADAYREGAFATLYLSPSDYHRVHSPATGVIRSWRHVPGRLYPVNTLAVRHVDALYTINERVVIQMDTERFGPMAVVLVGATNVGRITLSFTDDPGRWNAFRATHVVPERPIEVRRGDEIGVFNLGSTVVLLAGRRDLEPAGVLPGEHLQMGRALMRPASE
ncbi:MAG: archaetidylserine decarboxylase [Myxococcota bacterium]